MTQLLVLAGPPALSRFRLEKMQDQLALNSAIYAEYVHLLELVEPLTPAQTERAETLLRYGPVTDLPVATGKLSATVVPREGTISPWSSKATDIFSTCELATVLRVERGVRWYMDPQEFPAARDHLFDRMTQRIAQEDDLISVFRSSEPRPLSTVPLLSGGPEALQEANIDRKSTRLNSSH